MTGPGALLRYSGHFRKFGNWGVKKGGDSKLELSLFVSAHETDVRNAGTGMVEVMTTRTHSAVRNNCNGKVKRLIEEARKIVDEKAFEIAEALLEATKKGHVMSTKLLIELAAAGVDIEEALTKRPLITLAMRLASEPQMPPASPDDEDAETEVENLEFVAA